MWKSRGHAISTMNINTAYTNSIRCWSNYYYYFTRLCLYVNMCPCKRERKCSYMYLRQCTSRAGFVLKHKATAGHHTLVTLCYLSESGSVRERLYY